MLTAGCHSKSYWLAGKLCKFQTYHFGDLLQKFTQMIIKVSFSKAPNNSLYCTWGKDTTQLQIRSVQNAKQISGTSTFFKGTTLLSCFYLQKFLCRRLINRHPDATRNQAQDHCIFFYKSFKLWLYFLQEYNLTVNVCKLYGSLLCLLHHISVYKKKFNMKP